MFLQADSTTDSPCTSDLKSNSEKLKVIEQKIADKTEQLSQPTTFAGAKLLSRHEMDLEKAVTRDRDPTKVFDCLVTKKSVDSIDPEHPINHLDQIWKDVLSSKPTCRRKKRKRGVAVVTDDTASSEVPVTVSDSSMSEAAVTEHLNHTDVSVKSPTHESTESLSSDYSNQIGKDVMANKRSCKRRKRKRGAAVVTDKTDGCKMTVNVTDGNVSLSKSLNCGDISVKSQTRVISESSRSDHSKQAKCPVEPVPTEVIERYRLSIEQIRQLPRFQNYDAGTPSPVC